MHILKVKESCNGCKICQDVCFVNSIGWDEENDKPVFTHPEDCQICAYCEKLCPEEAMEIIPDWSSRYNPKILSTDRR